MYINIFLSQLQTTIAIIFSCLTDKSPIQDNVEQCDKELIDKVPDIMEMYSLSNSKSRTTRLIKGKKKEITQSNAEETVRTERIKQIMQQEQHLANVKLKHEERMAVIKEEHQKEFNYLQLKHLKEIHEEEVKIKKAKLKSMEYQLQQKENIDPHI